ncbi:hypothetical protein BLD44_029465 [Mastigocladus laminosus UU774]|nr:hypothetical protein BLD44_029465 [Mastigocladus laminosus UU774]
MVTFCKALNDTMTAYGIKGAWLAQKTGLTEQTISNFRVGRNQIKSDSLEKLISALPPDARDYFFQQLNPVNRDLKSLILRASNDEKAEILRIMAASLASAVKTDNQDLPMAV